MILKDELTEALKDRIGRDLGSPMVAGWEKVPLGQYYFALDPKVSEIVIERVVGEVLDAVLTAHGQMISSVAWADFFSGIDPTTTPESAIGKMLDAASTAVPKPHSTPFFLRAVPPPVPKVGDEGGRKGRSRSVSREGTPSNKRSKSDSSKSKP